MTRRATDKRSTKGEVFDPKLGRTKQALVSANINDIMKKYHRENDLVPIASSMPMYGDFSEVGDFQQGLDQVKAAQADFMKLPSAVRSMCDNSPDIFIKWISDPENHDQAVELKLLDPPPPPKREPETVTLTKPKGVPDGTVQGGG